MDLVLPFGLCSAAKIFNTALAWHLTRAGVEFIDHYLDDFIILGAPGTSQCQDALAIVDRECVSLGVLLASHKREGPSTCITFLGIRIDTVSGQLELPTDKLAQLHLHLHPVYNRYHLADDLSHNDAHSFLVKVPRADRCPSKVSLPLLKLLLDQSADWTSPTWRRQFGAISRQV